MRLAEKPPTMDTSFLLAYLALPLGLGWWMLRQIDSARRDLDRWPEPQRTVMLPDSVVDIRDQMAAASEQADGPAAAAG